MKRCMRVVVLLLTLIFCSQTQALVLHGIPLGDYSTGFENSLVADVDGGFWTYYISTNASATIVGTGDERHLELWQNWYPRGSQQWYVDDDGTPLDQAWIVSADMKWTNAISGKAQKYFSLNAVNTMNTGTVFRLNFQNGAVTWTAGSQTGTANVTITNSWQTASIEYDPVTGLAVAKMGEEVIFNLTVETGLRVRTVGFTNYTASASYEPGTLSVDNVKAGPGASAIDFTPGSGSYTESQNVAIVCGTPDAVIRYTTDGSEPSETNGTVITSGGSVLVDRSMTLKAAAWVNGTAGRTANATYNLVTTVIERKSGRIDTLGNTSGMDLVLHNGSVHIDGTKYPHILLSGTVSNWTGETAEDWTWAAGFITLLGADYFVDSANVPLVVDESMTSIFSYLGNSDYGLIDKQMGFGANAGMVLWKAVAWKGYTSAFGAQDCAPDAPDGYDAEMGRSLLSDPSQFEYELLYDLANSTLTARYRDVGDSSWDYTATIKIGYRNDYTAQAGGMAVNDDWSDLILSVQMANNLDATTYTNSYGFDYTITMKLADVVSGDANFDGSVDVGDLGILAANYGGSGKTWSQGDFNGDGSVDVGDLGILAANYGTGSHSGSSFNADYAKVFGSAKESATSDDTTNDDTDSSICSSLGLSLVAGLALMGLLLVKLEE